MLCEIGLDAYRECLNPDSDGVLWREHKKVCLQCRVEAPVLKQVLPILGQAINAWLARVTS